MLLLDAQNILNKDVNSPPALTAEYKEQFFSLSFFFGDRFCEVSFYVNLLFAFAIS